MSKRVLALVALAAVMLLSTAAVAFAEGTPQTYSDTTGASAWTYSDKVDDAAAVTKTEGSYRAFDDTSTTSYTTNPHGGYSTTSNKCKTCHAVHRANGSFALLRVDNPDDACNYCHIGAGRHADSEAYFGGDNGIYSSNGHTIGSGKEIPDSSVWQWTEDVTLTDADGNSETFPVRRYLSQRNKVMRYIVHGNRWIRVGPNYLRCASCHQVHNATRQIWTPTWSGFGPSNGATAARTEMTQGYKLLRNSPSGGIQVNTADINPDGTLNTASANPRVRSRLDLTYYDPGDAGALDGLAGNTVDYRLKAVDSTIGVDASAPNANVDDATIGANVLMGANKTGYTPFVYFASTNSGGAEGETNGTVRELPVFETSLAFWCADCHNLNIAGRQQADGFGTGRGGDSMLSDRSHAVPNMLRVGTVSEAGMQCYGCHNNDMPLDGRTTVWPNTCGRCHVTPEMYHYYKNGTTRSGSTWSARNDATAYGSAQPARSDFPHAGSARSFKLLNARDRMGSGLSGGDAADDFGKATDTTAGHQVDKVCKTCHGPVQDRDIGRDK